MSSDSCDAPSCSVNVALLVLVGLPGSGKTSLCLRLPQFLGSGYHIIHICYDQIIPFREDMNLEETHGSWKNKRVEVVQVTETLLKNLISGDRPENEKSLYHMKPLPDVHEQTGNYQNKDKDLRWNNIHKETKHDSLEMGSSSNFKHMESSNPEHYTMLDSFKDIVSIRDKLNKCDIHNELFVFCIDDNCYYRSMRKQWWNLAAKYELPFCIVTLKSDVQVCISRVRERCNARAFHGPNVPETVISRMDKIIEFPDGDLYSWEKHSIVIDSNFPCAPGVSPSNSPLLLGRGPKLGPCSVESLNQIRELIHHSILKPAKCLDKEDLSFNTPVTVSIIHVADLILRKIVGESKPNVRHQINKKRKKILEDLKCKKLSVPSAVIEEGMDGLGNKFEIYMASLINLHY